MSVAADAPAPGVYRGEGLTLELKSKDATHFAGTVTLGSQSFPVEASFDESKGWSGTFASGANSFPFRAQLAGNNLIFKTADTEYKLVREAPAAANPLAKPQAAAQANPLNKGSGEPAPAGTMKFTRLGVKDPGINNIEAFSFLIPAGWKSEGGIQWFPDYSILANLLMKITDPQTGAQVEFLPIQNFTWLDHPVMAMRPGTNYMGNIVYQPVQDVPQFIQLFYMPKALPHLQQARPIAKEDLTKVADQVKNMWGGQADVKSARVRYEYAGAGGASWEEDVYVTLVYTQSQMGWFWSVTSAHSLRAPKGQLDKMAPLMMAMVNSSRMNPEWYGGYMYVQKLFMDRMNQGIKNAAAISATITKNSEEIRQMYSDSYKQRCESQDRISQSFSEYIRGVDTYKNPYEDRPVQLPSGYNDAWVNSQGEYILSAQAGFDPNVGSTTEWRRMDKRE